ncbi:MAG: hypothetical protein ACRD4D_05360, partial [Candidatus Acidiferrales bacterium]
MRKFVALVAMLSLMAPMSAAAQGAVPIPVRKVVLYKNGMGYFEHLGEVRGQQSVEIALPSSQLNDVLKSLTVIDLGRGQVAGVTYDSAAPLDRRLAELPINLGSAEGLVSFLNEIRGAGVELRAPGGPVAGRLMGAELRTRSSGPGATVQVAELAVFTPAGEVRVVELESAGALRLTDAALASDVARYLELLTSAHQRDVRRLNIQTTGAGNRQLYVSYTSEAPIWKTTYRLVLDEKQKPLLQGWAIVDNTTPMDWENVELSLVAGAPVSFVYNLSQPVYARRPVVPLPQGVQVTPQTHEATLEVEGEQVAYGVIGGVPSGVPEGVADSAAERDEVRARREALPKSAPSVGKGSGGGAFRIGMSEAMRQAAQEAARAQALGEQFEYRLRQPVTVRRNQSALLPIINT